MELDCGGGSGSGLALLPIKNDLDHSDPLEARNSRIFDVHVSRFADVGKELGLANALAMGVQDTMPILFRYYNNRHHQGPRRRWTASVPNDTDIAIPIETAQ